MCQCQAAIEASIFDSTMTILTTLTFHWALDRVPLSMTMPPSNGGARTRLSPADETTWMWEKTGHNERAHEGATPRTTTHSLFSSNLGFRELRPRSNSAHVSQLASECSLHSLTARRKESADVTSCNVEPGATLQRHATQAIAQNTEHASHNT